MFNSFSRIPVTVRIGALSVVTAAVIVGCGVKDSSAKSTPVKPGAQPIVTTTLSGSTTILPSTAPSTTAPPKTTAPSKPTTKPAGNSANSSLAAVTFLASCGDLDPLQQPKTYTLTCADGNSALENLKWEGWGEPDATASGDLVANDCKPNCAAGKMIRFPVSVTASNLKKGEASARYTLLTVNAVGGEAPAGFESSQTFIPGAG
jgi:hypothetical protein